MTIESNRRRRARYMRRHNRWNPWYWPAWNYNYPRTVVVTREVDSGRKTREMILWIVALFVLMGLVSMVVMRK